MRSCLSHWRTRIQQTSRPTCRTRRLRHTRSRGRTCVPPRTSWPRRAQAAFRTAALQRRLLAPRRLQPPAHSSSCRSLLSRCQRVRGRPRAARTATNNRAARAARPTRPRTSRRLPPPLTPPPPPHRPPPRPRPRPRPRSRPRPRPRHRPRPRPPSRSPSPTSCRRRRAAVRAPQLTWISSSSTKGALVDWHDPLHSWKITRVKNCNPALFVVLGTIPRGITVNFLNCVLIKSQSTASTLPNPHRRRRRRRAYWYIQMYKLKIKRRDMLMLWNSLLCAIKCTVFLACSESRAMAAAAKIGGAGGVAAAAAAVAGSARSTNPFLSGGAATNRLCQEDEDLVFEEFARIRLKGEESTQELGDPTGDVEAWPVATARECFRYSKYEYTKRILAVWALTRCMAHLDRCTWTSRGSPCTLLYGYSYSYEYCTEYSTRTFMHLLLVLYFIRPTADGTFITWCFFLYCCPQPLVFSAHLLGFYSLSRLYRILLSHIIPAYIVATAFRDVYAMFTGQLLLSLSLINITSNSLFIFLSGPRYASSCVLQEITRTAGTLAPIVLFDSMLAPCYFIRRKRIYSYVWPAALQSNFPSFLYYFRVRCIQYRLYIL